MDPTDLRQALLQRDYARLSRKRASLPPEQLGQELTRARAAAARRRALLPAAIAYPEALPIAQARAELLATIRDHQVVIVCGETGSGKSTQLPKLCLELGRGARGLIGHTQPRRLAARRLAARIAEELGGKPGDLVGYETRFDKRTSPRTLVKLMTDGILLAELGRDRELDAYDTLIVDEAHERTLNIDLILGWLRRLLPRRPDLKVIVTSATLDPERLSAHFGGAPIRIVEGRMFPVTVQYRPPAKGEELDDQVAAAIDALWRERRPADTLVFLPGEREINELSRALAGRFANARVLPLYSRLPSEQQDRVFAAGGPPKIVLTTNVAETSITVPGVRYVIDGGEARVNRYSTRLGVQRLLIEPVSQAAASQRAGRCGRVGPGSCVRLYAEDDFAARPPFTDPEILRSNLAGVILQMTAHRLGAVEDFPWVQAPEGRHVAEGYRVLDLLGALDAARQLTPQGRALAKLPLDPRIARIALAAKDGPCAAAVFALAAALSVQDPHEAPPDALDAAREQHAKWRHPRSDFVSLLNLWQLWRKWSAELSIRALHRTCHEHFVSYWRLQEWDALHEQIAQLLGGVQEAPFDAETLYAPLHKALLAGLLDHVGVKLPESPEYLGPRGRKYRIFPGSALAKKSPRWIMSATLAQTKQLYARTNAAIEPEWLAEVGAHAVKRSIVDPTWNPERGEVSATEEATFLGLPLFKRTCHFGGKDPVAARAIFIRDGLVRGDLPRPPDSVARNLALAAEVREKEVRLRRPDLLADDAQLAAFYEQRLPPDLCTVAALRQWLKTASVSLQMREADALRPGANPDVSALFPDHLEIESHALALTYAHEPGDEQDGVTFHVPVTLLHRLPDAAFDWLVPGLRSALMEALIRTLPPHLRRFCTPAAEYANALAASVPPQGPLLPAICARFHEMTGVRLAPLDFAPGKLPAYSKPRFAVVDDAGTMLAEGASLEALREPFREASRAALNRAAAGSAFVRDDVRDWDFGGLPERVALADGVSAFPALAAEGDRVALRLFESAAAAYAAHAAGTRALLLARISDRVRDLQKAVRGAGLRLAAVGWRAEDIAADLTARAVDALLNDPPPRTKAAFQAAWERRAEFSQSAYQMLDDVAAWADAIAALRKRVRALHGRWPESLDDMRAQIDALAAPEMIRALPADAWSRMPVWLKAAVVRLERLPGKPQRDAQIVQQELAPRLARLPSPAHPARWLIEEWRVALFAQELRAQGAPSAARVDALLSA